MKTGKRIDGSFARGAAVAGAILAAAIGLPAPSVSSEDVGRADGVATEVDMTNELTFVPARVSIEAGETVLWTNGSMLVHTVTADPEQATLGESVQLPKGAEPFDSGDLAPDESFRHTFEVPGTYVYFCVPHEGARMIGTVEVTPAEEAR